jgi:hypothetical protein
MGALTYGGAGVLAASVLLDWRAGPAIVIALAGTLLWLAASGGQR